MEAADLAGCAGAPLPAAGADADLQAQRLARNTGGLMAGTSTLRYRPLNLARWLTWGLTALVMVVLPQLFTQGFALTLMSQMGVAIIFALSYNMLLGQSGMLSFGHAVYSGLGAYVAVHTLNLASKGQIWIPVSLLPLVGGLAGAFFGVLFGYVTTKRAGTTFAMITLGIGELVFSCSLIFTGFFGGEGGVTTNRVFGEPFPASRSDRRYRSTI